MAVHSTSAISPAAAEDWPLEEPVVEDGTAAPVIVEVLYAHEDRSPYGY